MRFLSITILLLLTQIVQGQIINPVKWTFRLEKVSESDYRFHAKAVLDKTWHIYSRVQPSNAISSPTQISFEKSAGLQVMGFPKELGKLENYLDKTNDIGANQFSDKVEFVQKIRVTKGSAKRISGTISYQACTNKKCLSPVELPFSVLIN